MKPQTPVLKTRMPAFAPTESRAETPYLQQIQRQTGRVPGGLDPIGSDASFDDREWVRVATALRYVEISRSHLYENFIKPNRIKTCCLRLKGNRRGIRLIYLPSLLALIHSIAEEQSPQTNDQIEALE